MTWYPLIGNPPWAIYTAIPPRFEEVQREVKLTCGPFSWTVRLWNLITFQLLLVSCYARGGWKQRSFHCKSPRKKLCNQFPVNLQRTTKGISLLCVHSLSTACPRTKNKRLESNFGGSHLRDNICRTRSSFTERIECALFTPRTRRTMSTSSRQSANERIFISRAKRRWNWRAAAKEVNVRVTFRWKFNFSKMSHCKCAN